MPALAVCQCADECNISLVYFTFDLILLLAVYVLVICVEPPVSLL